MTFYRMTFYRMTFYRMTFYQVFTLCVIFAFFSPLTRANTPPPTKSDIENLLPRQCYFSGSFVQTRTVENIPAPLEAKGNFLFSCDHGLIWQTESPTRETIIYTNGKKHFYVDSDGQVKPLTGRLHSNMARLLNGLMGADMRYMEEYFSVVSAEPQNMALQPKKKNMQRFFQRLNLHKDDENVEIHLINDANNNTCIDIFDTQTLTELNQVHCRKLYPEPADICSSLLQTDN